MSRMPRLVTGRHEVRMVTGGFHLLGNAAQLQGTVDCFRKNPVEHLLPMHCTYLAALCALHNAFDVRRLCAGDSLAID